MKTIKLKVNKTNLLSRLGEAFTDNQTVFKELAQNANRSKSTKLEIRTTDSSIAFVDNGTGIKDFQSLLTVAESGWDIETIEKNNAFGIGFLSAIYASEKVMVSSNGAQVFFDTKELLDGKSVDVKPSDFTDGTEIILNGEFNLDNLDALFIGFPIPVFINGEEVKRKDAFNEADFVKTDFGYIKFADEKYSVRNTVYSVVYLQGQQVYSDYMYSYGNANIVHLDDTNFKARLPDRDKLIDEAEVVNGLHASIKATYAQQALELVERLKEFNGVLFDGISGDEMGFIENSFSFVKQWNKEALNELDFVLGDDFIDTDTMDLVIGHYENADDNGWSYLSGVVSKKDLEGMLIIEQEGWYISDEQMDAMTFASLSKNCYVLNNSYPASHWINEMVSAYSEACLLKVQAVDTHKTAYNPSNWAYSYKGEDKQYDTSFCKSTELTLIAHDEEYKPCTIGYVENNTNSIYSHTMGEFFIVDNDNSAGVLLSAVGFFSEYQHEEYEEDEEMDTFRAFIRRNRITSDVDLLKELISNEIGRGVIPQELLGKELCFKWDDDLNVVDLKVA